MDVALFGQYAYVAALEGGLQVVNISNPAAPSICGFYSTTNRASARGSRSWVGWLMWQMIMLALRYLIWEIPLCRHCSLPRTVAAESP